MHGAIFEGGSHARTTLSGVEIGVDVTKAQKIWNIFTALGNMAFAYAFSMVLIEVQVRFLHKVCTQYFRLNH